MAEQKSKKPEPLRDDPATASSGRVLILDMAAQLFRNKGYAATSLRDIASACGMKAGSLYYHFDSKDAIVSEVLRIGVTHVFDEVRRAVAAVGDGADAHELLGTAVTAHLKALLESENYTSANIRIFGQVPQEVKDSHLPLREIYEQFWADLLTRCSKHGDISPERNLQLARFFLIGAMNSTLEWFQPNKTPVEEIASELTAIFLDGLKG